jgi:pSer/pThr/pTyr-binding forkhead associated (FHA) protein
LKQPIVLRIYKGDHLFLVKQSQEGQVVMGREGQDVSLPGDRTSLLHASIQEINEAYWLMDLGSETGTLLNDVAVLEHVLQTGDVITIGDYKVEFYIGVPRPKGVGENTFSKVNPLTTPTPTARESAVAPSTTPAQVVAPPRPVISPESQPKAPTQNVQPPPIEVKLPQKQETAFVKPVVPTPPPISAVADLAAPAPLQGSAKRVSKPVTKTAPVSAPLRRSSTFGPKKKSRSTFAPPSRYSEVLDYVRPGKGTVVEVLVAWQERVISAHHFSDKKIVTCGPAVDSDVQIPFQIGKDKKVPLVRIDSRANVIVGAAMSGELIRGNAPPQNFKGERPLDQGEMARVTVNSQLTLIIRYTSDTPKPLLAPALDLSASEAVGVIMAFILTGIFGLYMFLYTPPKPLDDNANEEPLRTALIIVNPPKPPKSKTDPVPTPAPTPPQIVKSTPSPKKEPVKVAQKQKTTPFEKKDPGAASDVAPNKEKKKPTQFTSVKQGGAVKTSKVEGAQMQSPKKDVTKSGVFSVFGGGGKQNDLSKATSGAGELAGMANAATGKAGSAEDRDGEGLGTPFKDTGAGGNGTAQFGVPGVKTKGRGGGDAGFGSGGLGGHKGISITPGGNGESFSGTIDREAIRRVIRENINAFRACYERELNRNPDLQGKIVLEWDIGERGRVMRGKVSSNDMGNKAVGECILDRLKTLTFPEPPTANEVTVSYPFFFKN